MSESLIGATVSERLGGRWAISWQATAISIPLAVGVLVVSSPDPADSLIWLGIGLVAILVGGAWTYLMHLTVFRRRKVQPVALRWVIVLAAVSAVLYVGTAIVLGLALQVMEPSRIAFQFVPLLAVTVSWGLLFILVLDSQWRFREERTALSQQAVQQQLASAQEMEVLRQLRATVFTEAGERVRASSERVIRRIDELLTAEEADTSALATELRAMAASTVRPLSHELEERARRAHRSSGLFTGLGNIFRYQPFRPLAVSIVYAVTVTPWRIVENGLAIGLGLLLVTVALLFAIMTGLNMAMRRWPEHHVAIFVMGLVLVQVPTVILSPVTAQITGESITALDVVVTVIFGTVIVISASAYGSWNRTRISIIADFRREVDEQTIATLARGESLAKATEDVALVLHGSVQTQLHACALALEEAAREGDLMLVNQALVRARAVLENLGLDPQATSAFTLEQSLAAQVTQWNGLLDVAVDVDPQVARMTAHLARHVAAVVEEAIANAVHHGGASRVDVRIGRADEALAISVRDDGRGPQGGSMGLGSRLFSAHGGTWTLERTYDGTVLSLSLPVTA